MGERNRLKCPKCGSEDISLDMYPGGYGLRARFAYFCRKCGNQWEG